MPVTSSDTSYDLAQMLLFIAAGLCIFPALHALNVGIGMLIATRLRRRMVQLSKGRIVLSYDDGPSERLHRRVLSILAAAHVPATFYLLIARAEVMESSLRATKDAGHEIASHGFAHLDARRTSAQLIWRDLAIGFRFMAARGASNSTFRPPYGRVTLITWLQARRARSSIALWTIESGDTFPQLPSVASIVERVERDGGGVVLLHTHDRTRAEVEEYVVLLTSALIELGKRRGFEFTSCAALLRGS